MTVKQIYEIVNNITSEILGEQETPLQEDLSNIVDIGRAIFDAEAVDNYVKKLVNHIGKVIFVNRKYSGSIPSIFMDAWEFGSVLEKISAELPEASENESWELEDGHSYDVNVFYKPRVTAKFFNSKTTFEIDVSFTEKQVKESFSNGAQLNGFISMLYNEVDKSMTIKFDALAMRTVNNMIGETLYDEFPAGDYTGTSVKAVNLLKLYNDEFSKSLTPDKCFTDPDFIRYAVYVMGIYEKRLSKISRLFNIEGSARFTPADLLHVVLHSDFASAASVYLYSDTYHKDLVALPKAETVPYWQSPGDDYALDNTTAINIKTASGNAIEASGIIGVMFDRDALGITNYDRRVTTNYNAKAEFVNNYYKFEAGYFNDMSENFVVFYADADSE